MEIYCIVSFHMLPCGITKFVLYFYISSTLSLTHPPHLPPLTLKYTTQKKCFTMFIFADTRLMMVDVTIQNTDDCRRMVEKRGPLFGASNTTAIDSRVICTFPEDKVTCGVRRQTWVTPLSNIINGIFNHYEPLLLVTLQLLFACRSKLKVDNVNTTF